MAKTLLAVSAFIFGSLLLIVVISRKLFRKFTPRSLVEA
jgi:hypothetical protein